MTVEVTTLASGLRVVTETMPQVETVSCGVWVGAGARNEPAEINGVAHLLEHMAFKGTERRNARQIVEEIESVGGHLNAYTSREQTAYYAKVLKDDMPLALDILADILQHATFDAEELARERTVVLQEIGQVLDTPDDRVFDHFQGAAFPGQSLGRPVLGSAEIVGAMPREAIMGYMQRAYGADRMVVSAAGKLEHDRVVELTADLFDKLPAKGEVDIEEAAYEGGEQREKRDLEQVHLIMGFPGVSYTDPDFYAATVFSTLFGGGMSSRLFQEIREKRGLVYSIYSYVAFYADGGLLGIYAGTGKDEVVDLVPAIAEEIAKVRSDVDEAELTRAKNQLRAATVMSLESTGSRTEQLGQQMLVFGRPIPIAEQVECIEAVDADAVKSVADRIFAGRPTLAAIGPTAKLMDYDVLADCLAG
jgi:predicted Zn-dependent peptidase